MASHNKLFDIQLKKDSEDTNINQDILNCNIKSIQKLALNNGSGISRNKCTENNLDDSQSSKLHIKGDNILERILCSGRVLPVNNHNNMNKSIEKTNFTFSKVDVSSNDVCNDSPITYPKKFNTNFMKKVINNIDKNTNFVLGMFEFHDKFCFICQAMETENDELISADCKHKFCKKCGSSYYELKIKSGDFSLKCPYYPCKAQLSKETVSSFISPYCIQVFLSKCEFDDAKYLNNPEPNRSLNPFRSLNPLRSFNQNKSTYANEYEGHINNFMIKYKYAFEVTNNSNSFPREIVKLKKGNICPICHEPSLFKLIEKNYDRCLNCLTLICKFCLKKYHPNHLDKYNKDHCKIYFRKRKNKKTPNQSIYKMKTMHLLFFIIGYIVLFIGCVNMIASICSIPKKKVLVIMGYILVTIILIPIFFIVFPFFPFLIIVLDYICI